MILQLAAEWPAIMSGKGKCFTQYSWQKKLIKQINLYIFVMYNLGIEVDDYQEMCDSIHS